MQNSTMMITDWNLFLESLAWLDFETESYQAYLELTVQPICSQTHASASAS